MSTLVSRRDLLLCSTLMRSPAAVAAQRIWSGTEAIQWTRVSPDGTKYAVLYGDRDKAGSVFSYAFWMPAGVWVGGHRHNQTAHVAVLEGELLLGFGRKMDRQKVVRVPRGGFFVVEAEEPHFEGCERDTLIVGTAMGGWRTTEFE